MPDASTNPHRLPSFVVPSHYRINLEPNLDEATFSGSVEIEVEVGQATDNIQINSADLVISSAFVRDAIGGETAASGIEHDEDMERATLSFDSELRSGPYTIVAEFTGILNDQLHGFYRSVFTDDDGVEHTIATTQFESTHARRAFPCFDEPAFKASYGVTLVVPEDQFAVSNGPDISTTDLGDGRKSILFEDTMVMSTYLVAFIVGPFEATEPIDVDGVPLRIVHPIGKGHLTDYSLEAGAFALKFFSNYYGIPYPGQKLDMVAVPDFAFGAMENLGCITYREVLLLVDKSRSTEPELLRVADVIAHEIAHMWFGDLVTMEWWNGIWLNEAFATFMATMCSDNFNPDWGRWNQFSLERSMAFDVDSLANTRPIEIEVNSPVDAEGMFDLLTYEKGGSVLRMLEQYLGEEEFKDGIAYYLNKHKYGNTETNDLWDAIEHVTQQPARRIMDSWIFQKGYPLVSASISEDGSTISLSQDRFLYTEGEVADDTIWSVPVVLKIGTASGVEEVRYLLEEKSAELELDSPAEWATANAGGSGFFRARYSAEMLKSLSSTMFENLSPIERYGLVDDTWSSVMAGRTSASDFLDFARSFQAETDLDVWTVLSGCLSGLDKLVEGEAQLQYKAAIRDLAQPALDRLGWEPSDSDSSRDLELRGLFIRLLANVGDDDIAIKNAGDLHDSYLVDAGSVEPNVAAAATGVVASKGDSAQYEVFVEKHHNPTTPQEERRYQSALSAFPGEAEMDRTLAMTLDGTVRTQDAPYLLAVCMRNKEQGYKAWQFVKDNWEQINKDFPSNSIVRMLSGVTSLSKSDEAADVLAFFEDHEVPQGQLTLQQTLEKLRVNVALRERESGAFSDSLTS
ncbi:M1 family metallopeptidase [Candidatus Lucifugimonas marina]|uniref:Aminopeptidase n=1 Tax=Candidatus Lucifugimonas marina TaxID=3038979 RepID=A0AAJ6CUG3_9CHLR|nr:M1 family peptidase [SAR202 cluster bacterium JH702]MDG0870645.1 M1 family peptidase [SAR202 cluster bacterium JH639]WFG36589.1 M1 family peptidase [SAR202 cluster bacterium JH545]WFG40522.1 M1 family peptidase [SAR202 cluster bacterium JH1073]